MFNISKLVLKQALDLSPVATIIVDLTSTGHPVVYVNSAFEALSGFDAGELLGMSWDELQTDFDNAPHDGDTVSRIGERAAIACHPRLGAAEQLVLEMMPLYDRPGAPRYWMGAEMRQPQQNDAISDSERDTLLAVLRDARMQLRRLDGRDSATGVLNRRAFEEMLERDWLMARREQRNLSSILFRLNDFAEYRDVYGRHAADSCLRKVLHAITGCLRRGGDLAARYADDRFVILLNGMDEQEVDLLADQIAARVRGLSIHHPRATRGRFITVTYGLSHVLPAADNSAEQLLASAVADLEAQTAPAALRQDVG
jgi:diguanylate cyclase (GGDEF)-like protein